MLEIPMTRRQKGKWAVVSFAAAAIVLSLAMAEGFRRERQKNAATRAENVAIAGLRDAAESKLAAAQAELIEARAIREQQAAKLADIAARDQALAPLHEVLGHGVMRIDADGRVLEWNKTLENWTGWTAEEMFGHTLERVMRPDDYADHAAGYPKWLTDPNSDITTIYLDCDLLPRDRAKPPVPVRVGASKIEQIGDGVPPIAIGLIHLRENIADLTKGESPPQ